MLRRYSSNAWQLFACVLLTLSTMLSATVSQAIPAWSRFYNDPPTDCASCHTSGGWQLNKRGVAYLRYGHQFEGDNVKPNLSDYVSLSFKGRVNGGESRIESFEEHSFSIYTGGPLGKGFSFFGELYFHEAAGKTSAPADKCDDKCSDFGDYGRSKLAEAYVQYTHGGEENYTSVRFGQIMPQLLHFNNGGARLSSGRPMLWTKASINKDNPYQAFSRQYGLDVSQHIDGWNFSVGTVNGTGFSSKQTNTVDNNDEKDVFSSIDYTFDKWGSNLGLFAYDGHSPVFDPAITDENVELYTVEYQRYALIGNWVIERQGIMAAYLYGEDTLDDLGNDAIGQGYYVQPYFYPTKNTGVFARFEKWDMEGSAATASSGATVGASYVPFEYGRFVMDVTRYGHDAHRDTVFTLEANYQF